MPPKRKQDVSSNTQTPHKRRITTIKEVFYESLADDLDHLNNRIEDVLTEEALSISRIRKTLNLRSDAPLDQLKCMVRDAFDEASDALEEIDTSVPKVIALLTEVRKYVGMIERLYNPIAWKDLLGCLWRLAEIKEDGRVGVEGNPKNHQESNAPTQTEFEGMSGVDTPIGTGTGETLLALQQTTADSPADVEMKTSHDPADLPLASLHRAVASSSDIGSDIDRGFPSRSLLAQHRDTELLPDAENQSSSQTVELNTDADTKQNAATKSKLSHSSTAGASDHNATKNRAESHVKFSTSAGGTIQRFHTSRNEFYDGYQPGPMAADRPEVAAELRASRASDETNAINGGGGSKQKRRILKLKNGVVTLV